MSQGPEYRRTGQTPVQHQRPVYGQNNPYAQPPVQRYNNQYQQSGHVNPNQYGQYSGQQQTYGQQRPTTTEVGKSLLEDSSATVKDALGKSWQGILGFSNRTRELMGQARDEVVSGANAAGQTLSEKSTSK